MKTTLLLLVSLAIPAAAQQQPVVPRKAENIGIQTGPGKYLWLSDYSGKTCIMAFILTSCPHCQYTTGILNRIQYDYAAKNVQVIASAIEPMSSLNIPEFREKFQPAFPVGYNEQSYIAKFLGLGANDPMMMPQLAFVDRNGIIRVQISGDDAGMKDEIQEKTLRDAVEKTIAAGLAKKESR
jgi:peroxiredoxin